ncbi:MAG: Fumarylacetoacetate hydrolase family [Microbacteriaceae bacterium]|jgi:2-keto-4-pentenoate hydratase/2-oxohepta-3-ene-1,7-dioic acid hydratase in catechol pathway|nr:Fumarylacetoacetate hydrolase family [Microbacteriaceae bacterium]
MRIDVPGLIEHVSAAFRLEAGDIILTQRAPLAHGDRGEIEITGIGILRNHVRREVRAVAMR